MTNRVDELESQVARLQATVDGLTEELVEANERIRLLEESVDVDLTTGSRSVGHGTSDDTSDGADAANGADAAATGSGSDPLAESQAQAASRARVSDTSADDATFVDAGTDAESPGTEAGDSAAAEASDDGGDDDATVEDDDIIVA